MTSRTLCMCVGVLAFVSMCVGRSEARIDPESIVGIWLFDDVDGVGAVDSSGNELNGEINGAPDQVEGVFGDAVEFNGAGDTVEFVGFGLDFPTDEVTIVSWAMVTTALLA